MWIVMAGPTRITTVAAVTVGWQEPAASPPHKETATDSCVGLKPDGVKQKRRVALHATLRAALLGATGFALGPHQGP